MLSYLITLLILATVLGFVLYIVYRILISNVEKTVTFSGHSIAARLSEANGTYRANADGPLVYMTFGDIKLDRQQP